MNELILCPFCGSNNEKAKTISVIYDWGKGEEGSEGEFGESQIYVQCGMCGARTDKFDTDEEAIAAWNRRAENKK